MHSRIVYSEYCVLVPVLLEVLQYEVLGVQVQYSCLQDPNIHLKDIRAFLISFCIFIYIKKIVFVNVFPIYVPYEKQPYQKQK